MFERSIVISDKVMDVMRKKCEWCVEIKDEVEDVRGGKCEMVEMRMEEYVVMGVKCGSEWRVSGLKRW